LKRKGDSSDKKVKKKEDTIVNSTEEIANKIFDNPEPEGLEKINQESDSVQIIILEKIDNETWNDSDSPSPIYDLLGDDTEDDAMETDLKSTGKSDAPACRLMRMMPKLKLTQ
jgi:hypothetical protein